ncbi:MAG: hypothetical protein RL417_1563 [Pseudomonadota bacterium]|jgi:hypothetical protein
MAEAALTSLAEEIPDQNGAVETIKSDFSVFAFTALHLSRKLSLSDSAALLDSAPLELMRRASPEDLSQILRHAAERCGPSPAGVDIALNNARIRHAIVSASSAELLAAHFDVNPESAYSCALFRQVGNALIAWNYPQVYRRALTLVRRDASLDSIVEKILGFSPTLLGLTIAQRWGLSPELLRGMGDKTPYDRAKGALLLGGDRLNEVCSLGEAVAQCTEPAAYPGALERWPEVRATVERLAGSGALLKLRDALAYNARVYLAVEPPIFNLPPEIVDSPSIDAPRSASGFRANLFAQRCPEGIQDLFRNLYVSIDGGRRDSAIAALLNSIAPTLGFKSGCVFLHEIDTDLLKPHFTAGDLRPVDYPTFRLNGVSTDPITITFLRETSHDPLRDGSAITGALGEQRHTGVLKLIAGPELRGLPASELDLLFRAFRKAVEDCLDIV